MWICFVSDLNLPVGKDIFTYFQVRLWKKRYQRWLMLFDE